jgi:hypothetical protein
MPNRTIKAVAPKLDAKGKPVNGRFVVSVKPKGYVPRILRGSIQLPHEQATRDKAEAKRARKADARLAR